MRKPSHALVAPAMLSIPSDRRLLRDRTLTASDTCSPGCLSAARFTIVGSASRL